MPKLKAALDIKNLKKELRDDLEASVAYKAGIVGKGVAGSRTTEPIPRLSQANCENIMESGTNASIVIGKDRPGSKLSGYGGRGDAGAGTIDIVAGRMSHNPAEVNAKNELIQANPDFKIDASRIYISQKTDVDDNFDLAEGKIGNSKARSAIAIKSDAIRLIAREGIKLVTGTDINKLTDFVDKLSGIVSGAITYQMKFNTKVMTHTHITAFFGTPTAPSEALIPAGIEVMKNHGTKTIAGIVKFRTNLKFHKQTYYAVSGAKYINSSFNNTN